jgi:two-component system, cell cycle sensor histidine kinase and response regulator CckA
MGTVFKIYLPCVSGNGRAVESEGVKSETAPGGSETILLVEDEPAVRKAAAEFLRLRGYTVLDSKDGLDALSVARNHGTPIQLVVTDVVMPNMSGGQLASRMRKYE